jgi:geranylgeranyl pyrophosphate synthase
MRNQRHVPGFQRMLYRVDSFLQECQLDPLHTRLMQQSLNQLRQDFFADKMIPALVFPEMTREALGQEDSAVFDTLGAVHFLFYAFLDLTDDVEDRDLKGALWQDIGEPAAINIGTSFLFLSFNLLNTLPLSPELKLHLYQQFSEAGYALTAGQHRDLLSFRSSTYQTHTVEDALTTHLLKTGSSLALYLTSTACVAGATEELQSEFESLGHTLGILLQILGDWRDTETPFSPDFVNACQSVPLSLLSSLVSAEDALYLSRLLAQAHLDEMHLMPFDLYRYLLRKYRVIEHVQALLDRYYAQAMKGLQRLHQQGVNVRGFSDFLARFPRLCGSDHALAVSAEVDGL